MLLAICRLDDDAAAPILNPLLDNPDSWVRKSVVDALGRSCHVSSMPYFAAALDDQDPYVAQAAIYGLLHSYQRMKWPPATWAQYKRIGSSPHTIPEWDSGMLPNEEQFRATPAPYRDWWKNWWETTGKAAYTLATQVGNSPPA